MEHKCDCGPDFEQTVDVSRQESLRKAVELAQEELNRTKRPSIQRPEIQLGRILLRNLLWLAVAAIVYGLLALLPLAVGWRILGTALAALVISLIQAKRIVISLVLIYQRYAPETLRAACVFEPTCSQYMILAVEKYGAFKGVAKGIGRLKRCHYPNSGEDYP